MAARKVEGVFSNSASSCDNACLSANSSGDFAAELFAPQNRSDMLARAEIKMLGISATNTTEIMFARSVEVAGRVLLRSTDETSVAAKLSFRRPSRIPGAPEYVVNVTAAAGKRAGEPAFRVRLLPNIDDVKLVPLPIPFAAPDQKALDRRIRQEERCREAICSYFVEVRPLLS